MPMVWRWGCWSEPSHGLSAGDPWEAGTDPAMGHPGRSSLEGGHQVEVRGEGRVGLSKGVPFCRRT